MANFLYEFLPVLLFFIAFKWYGIYTATVVGIVATALQAIITRIIKKRYDKKQLITLSVFVLFGGMTLYFHNPIFVKWKPTIVFWIFGFVFLISQFVGKKTLVQRMFDRMMQDQSEMPIIIWRRLNIAWSLFFILLGTLNIYIAYTFSTDAWVNFKFYGILGLLFLFSLLQAIYLAKHMKLDNK